MKQYEWKWNWRPTHALHRRVSPVRYGLGIENDGGGSSTAHRSHYSGGAVGTLGSFPDGVLRMGTPVAGVVTPGRAFKDC